jgi:acyl-CoA hydrolase
MKFPPKKITLDQIADVISEKFNTSDEITCYVGSNAATPTASLEALTAAIKSGQPRLPFLKMVHLLLQGPVPYVEEGLQDRVMTYSTFSGGDVRQAANEGRAYYLPCTLANLSSLIGKGHLYEPDVVFFKVRQNDITGEYSLGLSVEALHTAIDHAEVVIAELDPSMPFTQGQSVVDAQSIDYIIQEDVKPVYHFSKPDFNNLSPEEKRVGELITNHFIEDGITLQVGIGKIPDAVIGTIKDGGYKDLGIQTELYGDGLMLLEKEGIVTEYGVADLRELTSGEKALAVASIAHPKFRDDFLRSVVDDPLFTKPFGFSLDRIPRGVRMYEGRIGLED